MLAVVCSVLISQSMKWGRHHLINVSRRHGSGQPTNAALLTMRKSTTMDGNTLWHNPKSQTYVQNGKKKKMGQGKRILILKLFTLASKVMSMAVLHYENHQFQMKLDDTCHDEYVLYGDITSRWEC